MSFSLPGLAVQKDKVEQKLLNFFFFFKLICSKNIHLTILALPTWNVLGISSYPIPVYFMGGWGAGGSGRELWLQCLHAVDFMTHTCRGWPAVWTSLPGKQGGRGGEGPVFTCTTHKH